MPASRRYAFHKGKLFIEEGDSILMMNPWPNPWAKVRTDWADWWSPVVPSCQVVVPVRRPPRRPAGGQLELGLEVEPTPGPAEKRRIALARFRSRLPKPVARVVEPLRSLQWQHLVACAMTDRFRELVESNPILGYLWIQSRGERLEAAAVRAAAETPQRELLEKMELPGSKAVVKFLRKCYAPALSPEMAEGITKVLRDHAGFARLGHLPRAGSGVIALARTPRLLTCCAPSLLDEVAQCKDELYRAPTALRLENHLEMCTQLGVDLRWPFRSRDDLHHAHRNLVREYQVRQRQSASKATGPFGLPPLPGTQTIQPLTSAAELRREGQEQDNCVASYASRVSSGSHYIYRLTWPERCTLSIVKGTDGRWRRAELEVAGNRPASARACSVVDAWLRNSQRLLGIDK